MNPWFETLVVISIALLGIYAGRCFSRTRRSGWLIGYFFGFIIVAFLIMGRFWDWLAFTPAFCWIIASRVKFAVMGLAVTIGLTSPLSRLPRKAEKILTCSLMVVVVIWFSVLPFLMPALVRNKLENLPTMVDSHGICFQTTDYTCAPAAAVTALGRLGLQAEEGKLAVLAHSSPVFGTLPLCLEETLKSSFADDGLRCRYRRFDSVEQLKTAGITLAVVKNTFFSDHCVAVLGVSDDSVLIADPVAGQVYMSHEQFAKIWRFTGISLKRQTSHSI